MSFVTLFAGGVGSGPPPDPVIPTVPLNEELNLCVGQRQAGFYCVLVDGETGADAGILNPLDLPPTLSLDTGRSIMRTVSNFQLAPGQAQDVHAERDRVRIEMVVEGVTFQLGEYVFADRTFVDRSFGSILTGSLGDKSILLDRAMDRDVALTVNADLASVARELIIEAGVDDYAIEITGATAGAAVGWTLGSSTRLKILRDIAALGGWFDPYFDNLGVFRMRRAVGPSADPVAVTYRSGENVVEGSVSSSDNLLDLPNRFIVVDTGVTKAPVVGTFDVPAGLPWSAFARGGQVIPKVFRTQGVGTLAAAVDAARVQAQRAAYVQTVTFTGPADPRHDTFSTIEFDGIEWLETAWTMPLRDGATMTHQVTRSVLSV